MNHGCREYECTIVNVLEPRYGASKILNYYELADYLVEWHILVLLQDKPTH